MESDPKTKIKLNCSDSVESFMAVVAFPELIVFDTASKYEVPTSL